MSKTYLITGGAGFIGANFVDYIYHKYPESKIIVLDLLTYAGNVEYFPVSANEINPQFEFVYGDVRNSSLVESLVAQADIVVHFAAETHTTRSIFDNRNFFETDIIGTQTIANAVLKFQDKVERFIHISSSEVYGTAEKELMAEDHPLNPTSPYAAAKAGADRLVYSYVKTYEIPAIIIRPFNNYGSYQHLEKVVPRFITSGILGEELTVHGNGEASRDFLHAEDTCEAIDMLIQTDINKVKGEVFNIGTGRSLSVREIADLVTNKMNINKDKVKYISERPGQVDRHTADISKIKDLVGWTPKIRFEDGIIKAISWYRHHRHLWEKQMWLRKVPILLKDGSRVLH